jgi:DNA-binding transcriptional LysR family regulator
VVKYLIRDDYYPACNRGRTISLPEQLLPVHDLTTQPSAKIETRLELRNGGTPVIENFRLKVFRTVAEHCHFRKAADHLYLTQPAVTHQIRALEEMCAVSLFDRTGKNVTLTPSGKILLKYVKQIDALLARAEEEMSALAGEIRGELRIAASMTIAQFVLPHILGEFVRFHPSVQLVIESSKTEEVIAAVMAQRVSLGLIEGPAHTRDVQVEPWIEDELVMAVPASHEWDNSQEIAMTDLKEVRLLMRERGSGTREIVEQSMADHGIDMKDLKPIMEVDSTEGILASIEAGLGVGFVSRRAIRRALLLGTLKMVPIRGVRLSRRFSMIYNHGPEPTGLPGLFLNHLREEKRHTQSLKSSSPRASAGRSKEKKE